MGPNNSVIKRLWCIFPRIADPTSYKLHGHVESILEYQTTVDYILNFVMNLAPVCSYLKMDNHVSQTIIYKSCWQSSETGHKKQHNLMGSAKTKKWYLLKYAGSKDSPVKICTCIRIGLGLIIPSIITNALKRGYRKHHIYWVAG